MKTVTRRALTSGAGVALILPALIGMAGASGAQPASPNIARAGASAAGAADSSSGATVTEFSSTNYETFRGALPECFQPDLVGTNVATETTTGQIVSTPSGVFTVHGTNVFDYRVNFPNGMYAFGTSTSHFSFVATGKVTVFTQFGKEPRTVYARDGTPVAEVVIHAGSHITYHDLNGDGQPQPNEISASVEKFFFTCH
jgi:hypothetical protein